MIVHRTTVVVYHGNILRTVCTKHGLAPGELHFDGDAFPIFVGYHRIQNQQPDEIMEL